MKKKLTKIAAFVLAGVMALSAAACASSADTETVNPTDKINFLDSSGQSAESSGSETAETEEVQKNYDFSSVNVGDYITFGSYEQDNDTSNGKEDIEWLVLDKQGDNLFVISEYVLDCQQPYASVREDVTWETSLMRSWLNETFIDEAFTKSEQKLIQTTTVARDTNPQYNTSSGNETEDKIFLLSCSEFNQYFSEEDITYQTEYAHSFTYDDSYEASWALRTPGSDNQRYMQAYTITTLEYTEKTVTELNESGRFVDYWAEVRPAMWISTK